MPGRSANRSGLAEVLGPAEEVFGKARAPITVVSDNGSCFWGEVLKTAFDGPDPLLRHVRIRVRSPQANGVIERFFGTVKYEHLFRGVITDGDDLDMEVHRFRIIYNTIRPYEVLGDRTPSTAYTQQ
ncbi:integrase core domain-containing protein [Nocardia sp. CA-084685]|uniref:integrase core domain-containing protein n=1 Tax=Nocardia sp. CA-084685 TaxID=3239970 RepID=UPI003D984628